MLGERWGVTDQEMARRFPCDDLVPSPVLQLWRGITIEAPAELAWRWLCQVQLAPYSYDWLDNLGRRSPRDLRSLHDPRPGERFSRVAGRFGVGRVLSVTPGEQLTATVMGSVMSYVVSPEGASTRLVLKIVMKDRHWWGPVVALGDWPMARRQLKNFRSLAEAGHRTSDP